MNPSGSSLADWLVRLETFSPHEIELGLDRVLDVISRLDVTMPRRVFHIAGTNGKGSSVAMTQALLSESGETVGSYTSPHISDFNERICVNSEPVADTEIVAAFERVDAVRGETPLTYFEFGTIAAMLVFEARKVDTAILEIGMGGRLDAVNAIEPSGGLITNVSLDHCDWLGNDVETIAFEKAGIMRSGRTTIFGAVDAPATISDHAADIGADLVLAGRDYRWKISEDTWEWQGRRLALHDLQLPSLKGEFQVANAAGVLALIEAVGQDELLETEFVNRALQKPALAGRLQSVVRDRQWLLDVAHNQGAAEALAKSLSADERRGKTVAIVAMLSDKDVGGFMSPLNDLVDYWVAVSADNRRTLDAGELGRQIANQSNKGCFVAESLEQAMQHARERSMADDRILVTGSFYLVGPVLEALGIYSQRKGES
jgi:dihydrofolate synthase / folylpolyglutamate synthase